MRYNMHHPSHQAPQSDGTCESNVLLATGGYDKTIRLWNASTGNCYRTMQHPDSQVNALEFTPDKQQVAAAGYQHIQMYDLKGNSQNPFINFEGVSKNITCIGFHCDGKWMYSGGEDNSARIWDMRARSLQCQRVFQVNAAVNHVCLHPNQGELFVADQSGSIHIWDLKTDHNEQLVPETDASIQCVDVDPEGSYMAAVNNKGTCYVWSLTGGIGNETTHCNPRAKIAAHKKYILKCKFSPDSTLLATTSADHTVRIWKTADFSLVTELSDQNQRWVWDVAFTCDSQYVLTASSDGTSRLWSLDDPSRVQREYSGHSKAVTALAFCDT